ncbi:TraB/GumN family protein [Microbulbifer sp. MLAF003]|nr:TraB/GumN family protein [Microbulbifer sp. MLAF003]WHI52652.1 TraB/GumN family protein [Microbulbifer sp. MLAF003]
MIHRYLSQSIALALILFVGLVNAAETDQGIFWKATKENQTIYLLGSIHLATEDFYPMRPQIERAYAESDAIAVEADILAAEGNMLLQQKIMMESVYQGERNLRDDLPRKRTNSYRSGYKSTICRRLCLFASALQLP